MLIPPEYMEIEKIYSDITAARYRSVVITSANSGEGVTTVASAIAQRHLLSGNSALVVDLNLHNPNLSPVFQLDQVNGAQALLQPPQLVSDNDSNSVAPIVGVVAPKDRGAIIKLSKPGIMESFLENWHESHDLVIIDTSPVNRINGGNIPAERIAAACDACILVVLAGHTREAMVVEAVNKLRHAEANFIGCVLNNRDNPSLQYELIRQARRLEKRFTRLSLYLQKKIKANQFLSPDS